MERSRDPAAQFDLLWDDSNQEDFPGAFTAEFGKQERLDESRVMRADTLRNGYPDKLLFAEEADVTGLTLGADGVDQNDGIVIPKERGDAQAGGA